MAQSKVAMSVDVIGADPKHYSVVTEDERVRVLRVDYKPGDESVMHSHPECVVVFLSDAHMTFSYPDGTIEEVNGTAGEAMITPAMTHLPRNLGDTPVQAILIELKS